VTSGDREPQVSYHPAELEMILRVAGIIPLVLRCRFGRGGRAHAVVRRFNHKREDRTNKPRHVTTSSRSVEMIFRNYNLNPESDTRPRY
jgi:hypothetical protein